MSACISQYGEFSEHTYNDASPYVCGCCWTFDEDGALAEIERLRLRLAAVTEWTMVNEIAAPPLDWAGLGNILGGTGDH